MVVMNRLIVHAWAIDAESSARGQRIRRTGGQLRAPLRGFCSLSPSPSPSPSPSLSLSPPRTFFPGSFSSPDPCKHMGTLQRADLHPRPNGLVSWRQGVARPSISLSPCSPRVWWTPRAVGDSLAGWGLGQREAEQQKWHVFFFVQKKKSVAGLGSPSTDARSCGLIDHVGGGKESGDRERERDRDSDSERRCELTNCLPLFAFETWLAKLWRTGRSLRSLLALAA